MRAATTGVVFSWLFMCGGWAQLYCEEIISLNNKLGNIHFVQTGFVRLVVRSNYAYSTVFAHNENGVMLKVLSHNGGVLAPTDEIIFLDQQQLRHRFR